MTTAMMRSIVMNACLLMFCACSEPPPVFHDTERPLRLSDWSLFSLGNDELTPSQSSLVFQPGNSLFTDYAHKLRTLWMPTGTQARIVEDEIDYPVGTVLSKTFYYPKASSSELLKSADEGLEKIKLSENKLIETRLLVRKKNGWDAFPYVWNEQQSEAFLRVAGASTFISLAENAADDGSEPTKFTYFMPNQNQCAGCHTSVHPDGDMQPLGAILSQLTGQNFTPGSAQESQLDRMVARGWLTEPGSSVATESWQDQSLSIAGQALAYLNIHCGHCHNPDGAADTSGLMLDNSQTPAINRGVCKPPVAAGAGAGDLLYGIVPGKPEQSIVLYRMQSTKPDEMMPELGRSLIHAEGVDLISRWISEMPGSC